MAREKSFDERRREREREELEANGGQDPEKSLKDRRASSPEKASGKRAKELTGDGSVAKLLELMQRAEPLIEQVHSLYNQYLAGIETRPPVERRKQLDQVMLTLQLMTKPTPAYQFRYATINASYHTHRDRWDRLMKDLESGKAKRGGSDPRRRD